MARRNERLTTTASTKFTYDGDDVILDINADGSFVKYINGPGIDNKIRQTINGQAQYFIQDHLGSTNALTDATGNVVSSATYDAFGNATGNLSTRYQFTGRERDETTGLMYYRNRWYDSNLGRFISEDPIGLAGGINQFGYVGGNPVGFTDPSGLERYSLEQYRGDWNREKPVQPIDIDLDRIQIVLGVFGMIPGFGEPFDLIDGTICLVNGDYVGASLSATSAIPLFGTAAGIVKVTNRIGKVDNFTPRLHSRGYDRPSVEIPSGKAVKAADVTDDWDNFLGPNQTDIDPRDNLFDPDRIWSADGNRSIRFGRHEMDSKPNKMHYHKETWTPTSVENILQRVQTFKKR